MIRIFKTLFLLLIFTSLATPAFSQGTVTPPAPDERMQINLGNKQQFGIKAIGNPNGPVSVGSIVSNAITILYIAGGLATIIYFLWGAFDWITAGGDKEKIGSARKKIIQSLVGLALLAASFFIIALVGQIVGYNPLKTPPLPRLDNPV